MKDQRLQDKLSRMDEAELCSVYQTCFGTPEGKLVLEDLRNRCFIFMPTELPTDEGARRVILNIETRLQPEKEEENDNG